MRLVRRSFLNILRSPVRTIAVIVILAVSLGLALIMFEVHSATTSQLSTISSNIGNDITVRPAGYNGFGAGGGTPLPQDQVDQLQSLAGVTSVQETVDATYSGDQLVSGIDAGSLGNFSFGGGSSGSGTYPTPTNTNAAGRVTDITVEGVDPSADLSTLSTMGGGGMVLAGSGSEQMTIQEGRSFTASDDNQDVVIVGETLATKNNLTVGSDITIGSDQVQVIGIYSTGTTFADNMLIMPVSTVQRLYSIAGATSLTVVADNAADVNTVANEIRAIWPTNVADVTTGEQEYSAIAGSITNAGSSSQTGMLISFIVAAVVVLLSVVLVVRQRIKEIGIMKAVGASNWNIGVQFGLETVVISIVAAVIGVILSMLLGQSVANLLTSTPSSGVVNVTGSGGTTFTGGGPRFIGGTFAGIQVAVSPEVLLIAFGAALILAIAASTIPVWYIARVRPAEVLRNE